LALALKFYEKVYILKLAGISRENNVPDVAVGSKSKVQELIASNERVSDNPTLDSTGLISLPSSSIPSRKTTKFSDKSHSRMPEFLT